MKHRTSNNTIIFVLFLVWCFGYALGGEEDAAVDINAIIVQDVVLKSIVGGYDSTTNLGNVNMSNVQGILVGVNSLIVFESSVNMSRVDFSGQVTPILSGASGYQDGTGNEAAFGDIQGAAWDNTQTINASTIIEYDVYVCDASNHVIRKISTNLEVTTVAGSVNNSGLVDGIGSAAAFLRPTDICYSAYHKLYFIADSNIRSFNPATGNVSTVQQLSFSVSQIACGQDGTVYYSDYYAVVYKLVNIGTQEQYTFPWVGATGMPGCIDGTNAAARTYYPRALSAVPGGGLFITQTTCSSVRFAAVDGSVRRLTGSFSGSAYAFSPSSTPGGLGKLAGTPFASAYDPVSQALYLGDQYGVRVAYYTQPPMPQPPTIDMSNLGQTGIFTVSWKLPAFYSTLTSVAIEAALGTSAYYQQYCSVSYKSGVAPLQLSCNVSSTQLQWVDADVPTLAFRIRTQNEYSTTTTYSSPTVISLSADMVVVKNVTDVPTKGGKVVVEMFDNNLVHTNNTVTVFIGARPCTNVVVLNANSLTCNIGEGSGWYGVNVVVDGATDVTLKNDAFKYQAATISSVFPPASTAGGDIITLVGTNFGPKSDETLIELGLYSDIGGMIACTNVTILVAHEMVSCIIAEGTGVNNVEMLVNYVEATTYIGYSYQIPVLDSIWGNATISTDGTSYVDFRGKNFGNDPDFLTIKMTSKHGLSTDFCRYGTIYFLVPHFQFRCRTNQGTGINTLSLSVSQLALQAPVSVAYAAPLVTSASRGSTTTSQYITIYGQNFGSDASLLSITIPYYKAGNVSYVSCDSPYMLVSHTSVRCYMIAGTGGPRRINMVVDSITNTDLNTAFTYPQPVFSYPYVSSTYGTNGLIWFGGKITITGSNFGTDASAIRIFVNDTWGYQDGIECTSVDFDYYYPNTPVCTFPAVLPGTAYGTSSWRISASVNGQWSNGASISVFAPTLYTQSSLSVAATVTISGKNLGNDISIYKATFAGLECTDLAFSYYSTSSITCTTADGPSDGNYYNFILSAPAYGISVSMRSNYAYPSITTIPSMWSGDSKMTITGRDFGLTASALTVYLGYSNLCTNVTIITPGTKISCNVPVGYYSYSPWAQVYRGSQTSNIYYFSLYSGSSTYSSSSSSTGGGNPAGAIAAISIAAAVCMAGFGVCIFCIKRANANAAEERQRLLQRAPHQHQQQYPQQYAVQPQIGVIVNGVVQDQQPQQPAEPRPVVDSVHNPEEGDLVMCDICNENNKNTAMDCGHMTCNACSLLLTVCPFCKQPITQRSRIFLR